MKDNSNKNREIKVGDWVEVVRPTSTTLKLGTAHLVSDISCSDSCSYLFLDGDEYGSGIGWDADKFIKLQKCKEVDSVVKIDMQKKYRMVGYGHPARILCTDRDNNHYPVVYLYKTIHGEGVDSCDSFGMDENGGKVIEEVPEVDWSKVPVDTLIWLDYHPRYFAGYINGSVCFFTKGTTSLTYEAADAEILEVHGNMKISLEKPK